MKKFTKQNLISELKEMIENETASFLCSTKENVKFYRYGKKEAFEEILSLVERSELE